MSMQSQNTQPSRNPSAASGINNMVSVGKGSKAPNTAGSMPNPGPSGGSSIKGFGGSKAPMVPVSGNSGPTSGSSVKGFSGGGMIPGKV